MKISYHKDTDSLYMHLKQTPTLESEEVAPGTVVHFDEDGNVTGLEIYYGASEKADLSGVEVVGLEEQAVEAQGRVSSWQPGRIRRYVATNSKGVASTNKRYRVAVARRASSGQFLVSARDRRSSADRAIA